MNIIDRAKLNLQYLIEVDALPEEIEEARAWLAEVRGDVACDLKREGYGHYASRECPARQNPYIHDATEHHHGSYFDYNY